MISWLKRVVPRRMRSWLRQWRAFAPHLGGWGALVYALHRTRGGPPGRTDRVRPRQAMFPLHLRRGTSDAEVFSQVFLQSQYRPLCDLPDVGLVLDCGANVGYSSAFFLTQFDIRQDFFHLLAGSLRTYHGAHIQWTTLFDSLDALDGTLDEFLVNRFLNQRA